MNKEIEYITDIIYEFCEECVGDCKGCKVKELVSHVRGS